MKKGISVVCLLLLGCYNLLSQELNQTVKGKVIDEDSQLPLYGATIYIKGIEPALGTISDENGDFRIEKVPVGRYDINFSYIGYETVSLTEVLVGSGKEVVLNVSLKESIRGLDEVEISAENKRNSSLNPMAVLSAKSIYVEQANRYAGGFDDPARLASAFAGVASGVGNNGIVIRGNSPKGVLWLLEGVQIRNPNHFADYISLGGGAVTALSSHTLGATDFFTGAFPAQYGNALSGVFDMRLRTGNPDKREHTFQASLIGIDLASEGPFVKGKNSTYLFNYRYSTLGLLSPVLPEEMGVLSYQDLSFKLNFPVKNGNISFWGLGAYDIQKKTAEKDISNWESTEDMEEFNTSLTMGATGLTYRRILGKNTYIETIIAATQNSLNWKEGRLDSLLYQQKKRKVDDIQWKLSAAAFLHHKFSARHTNRTGFRLQRMTYDMNIQYAEEYGLPLNTLVSEKNSTGLMQFYSQSAINLSKEFIANLGMQVQYFTLNGNYSIEPRTGITWHFHPLQSVSVAYGLHAQTDLLQFYFAEYTSDDNIISSNKNLDFNKSHHFILGYDLQLTENTHLNIEAYHQRLFDIPVVPGSYISTINITEVWDFDKPLINEGSGKNTGIDISLNKYLHNGIYYMLTASLFNSRYTGGDGIERNTRYNRNYVFNILAGKEWKTGPHDKNLLGVSLRLCYMGGERIIPVDVEKSMERKEIVLNTNLAWEEQLEDAPILSASFNYRVNKTKYAGIWSLHIINALGYGEFQEFSFNAEEMKIEKVKDVLVIPNISYKILF